MMKLSRVLFLCVLMTLCVCVGGQAASGYAYEPPVPADYDMPYTLAVYLSRQMVVAYDAKTGEPVRYMICSSGAGGCTPAMTAIMPKTYTSGWDRWGNVYVRYPTKIRGSYFFHSTLYNLDHTPNAKSWRDLGRMASHGCIRMTPVDAQWINYNCKQGTRIRVVREDNTGLGLGDKNRAIRAALDRDGIRSVEPNLRPTPTPIPPTLDENSTQVRQIKALQQNLKEHGFYNGELSGRFDGQTVSAWNAYQKARGWKEDAIATTDEQIALDGDQTTIAYNVDLKLGSRGVIVRAVEERLKLLGYFRKAPNNIYDAVTVEAVKRYQKAKGIVPANGRLAAQQQAQLFLGVAPTPTPQPDLTVGSKGSRVKRLQQRLATLGCFVGRADGKYQATTAAAVRMYQEMAGLEVTGRVNRALEDKIATDDTVVGYARRLSIGSKGQVVKALEAALKQAELFLGVPDMTFDSATRDAVKALQTQRGEAPTGVADTNLLKALFTKGSAD
ncbi:MAG: peptidoglycan-binding protein [Clostridia bacterium]